MEQQPYVPALGFDWLTRFYDPVLRATVREETFKRNAGHFTRTSDDGDDSADSCSS